MTEIHLIQSCIPDKTWPVISDTGVVVRTSGCLNEQLSISWRVNQVQQRRREGGGGVFPACRGHLGYYPLWCKFCWAVAQEKVRGRNLIWSLMLCYCRPPGWLPPTFITDSQYGCRSGTSNASVLHTFHWLTYFPLVSVAACWNTGCILLQTPHPASVNNTDEAGYCTGKVQRKRICALCFKDKSEPLSDDSYTIIFLGLLWDKPHACQARFKPLNMAKITALTWGVEHHEDRPFLPLQ